MITETEVRRELVRLLENGVSLADFQDWLVSRSWNMHKDSSPTAQSLVSTVELALAEHSNGDLTETELRTRLWAVLRNIVVELDLSVSPGNKVITASSGQVRQAQGKLALA
jgi:hypothetical protein